MNIKDVEREIEKMFDESHVALNNALSMNHRDQQFVNADKVNFFLTKLYVLRMLCGKLGLVDLDDRIARNAKFYPSPWIPYEP